MRVDREPTGWLRLLAATGPVRAAALARLHEMLVRAARREVARRGPWLRITGQGEHDRVRDRAAAAAVDQGDDGGHRRAGK